MLEERRDRAKKILLAHHRGPFAVAYCCNRWLASLSRTAVFLFFTFCTTPIVVTGHLSCWMLSALSKHVPLGMFSSFSPERRINGARCHSPHETADGCITVPFDCGSCSHDPADIAWIFKMNASLLVHAPMYPLSKFSRTEGQKGLVLFALFLGLVSVSPKRCAKLVHLWQWSSIPLLIEICVCATNLFILPCSAVSV